MIDPAEALDRTVLVLQDYVAAEDAEIVDALTSLRVRLVASAETLRESNAQVAVLAAFETIARLGAEVVLDVPRGTAVLAKVPPLSEPSLYDSIEQIASRLIRPLSGGGGEYCDLTVVFDALISQEDALAIGASAFEARLRVGKSAGGFSGRLPFAAVIAGASVGTEVARLAIKRLIERGHERVDTIPLDPKDITLALPAFDYPDDGVFLKDVDFVSAGAITHATLFTLAMVDKLTLSGRVFDDDTTAVHNLNRYVLLDGESLGQGKEEQLAGLDWPSFDLQPEFGRVGDGELSDVKLLDHVVVGVDSVKARWKIQRLASGWVSVGATSHALAMVSEHWPDTPCSGCVHPQASPPAERLPTISFVSLLAGALVAYRVVRSHVAPVRQTEVDYVLDAFNLSAAAAFFSERPMASELCPVECDAAGCKQSVQAKTS